MKKLMTMIAAAAMAFGLYADGTLNHSVDFAEYGNVNPWTLTQKDGETPDTLWAWAGAATAPATDEAKIESGKLVLSTGSNVLSRQFATEATAIDDGLFVDMVLDYNGEALDTVPTVDAGKIAIFALDQTEIEGIPEDLKAETNVYVLANYGVAGKALYKIGPFDFTSPRRVALKAYKNVITGDADARAGFLVYMDAANAQLDKLTPAVATAVYAFDANDQVVWTDVRTEEPNYLGRSDVMSSKWVKSRSLFISLDTKPATSAKLASVDFVGRAKLASITLTDNSTDWPADDVRMAVELTDAEITDVTGAELINGELVADDNDVTVTFKAAPKSKDNVTVDYTGTISGPDVDGVYTITFNENNTLTVKGWDTAATVGDKKFESLFGDDGAIAYVNANGGTLKLADDVTAVEEGDAFEFTGADVVLDLAGNTLMVLDGQALSNSGKLTIIDSATGGTIVGTTENYNTMVISNGVFEGSVDNMMDQVAVSLEIAGGTFNGAVTTEDGCTVTATAGKFLQKDDQDEDVNTEDAVKAFLPDDTYEVVDDEAGYWQVQKAKVYVAQIGDDVKFETLADALAAAVDDDTITVIADCTADVDMLENRDARISKKITLDATDYTVSCTVKYPFLVTTDGSLTVKGGTFTQAIEDGIMFWAISNAKITIEGGDFSAIPNGEIVYVQDDGASAAISGGKFVMADGGDVLNVKNNISVDHIQCTGGSFSKDPDFGDDYLGPTFVADGYASTLVEGLYVVTPAAVKVGNKGFTTAAAALTAVQALEAAGTYPITVTALDDNLEVTNPATSETITLGKGAEIEITAAGWTFGGTVSGEVTLAPGKSITVPDTATGFTVKALTGYKVVKDTTTTAGSWIYTVKAIEYATLKVAAGDANVFDIVVTNAAGTVVAADTQFDIDDAVVVAYQTATFTSGYELDESKGILTVTLDKAGEATITVFSKETQSTPVIDPTQPSDPMDSDKADAAVEEINKNPAKYIKAPDEFGELDPTDMATYQGYFTAKKVESTTQSGKYDVVLELNSDGQTALQNSVNGDVVKIKPAEIAAGTATNVKIDAIPGFYYGVKAGNGIGNMAIKSSVPAKGGELTLDLPKFTGGAAFYTIVASPTPMAVVE